jgi:hypothetical protein
MLASEIEQTGVRWMHIELLCHDGITSMYSKAQGEE